MSEKLLDDQMINDLKVESRTGHSHSNFIQYYEMTAKSEMSRAKIEQILAEIGELASQSIEDLTAMIKAVTEVMSSDLVFTNEEIKIIVKKIKKFNEIRSPIEADAGIISIVAQILTLEYEKRYRGKELLDKNIALMRFLLNCDLNRKVLSLQANKDFFDTPIEVVYAIRDLAVDESVSRMLETLQNKQLHEIIYSMRATIYQKGRWAELNETYQMALKYAEDQWSKKISKKTRNEMAEHIVTNETLIQKYGFGSLNYERLRELLGPIARKHGMLPKRGRPRKQPS